MKPRIAIWTFGLGTGHDGRGIPSLEALLSRLSEQYELVVYNIIRPRREVAGIKLCHPPAWMNHLGPLRMVWMLLQFYKDHLRQPFDLLQGFYGIPYGRTVARLGKLLGLPSVLTMMGAEAANLPRIGYGHLTKPQGRKQIARIVQGVSQVICISQYQEEQLREELQLPEMGIAVIPFSVDLQLFGYRQVAFNEQKLDCIHIANQNPVKDQETLLRAFQIVQRHYPKARLTLVGGDFYEGKLKALVTELDLASSVSFAGECTYAEVARRLAGAGCLLHSSFYEGQGLIYCEAMASGTAIVSTQVGLVAHLPALHCRTVAVGDAEAMAAQVMELAQQPQAYQQQLAAAYGWIQKHDLAYVTRAYDQCWSNLIS